MKWLKTWYPELSIKSAYSHQEHFRESNDLLNNAFSWHSPEIFILLGAKNPCYLTKSRQRYNKRATLKASKLKCCNLFMSQVNSHHKPSQLFSKTLSLAVFGIYSFCNLKAELLLRSGTTQKNTWFIWYSSQGRAPRKTFELYCSRAPEQASLCKPHKQNVSENTMSLLLKSHHCRNLFCYWLLSSISQQLDSEKSHYCR